jgi:hypothetical protein
MKKSELKEMLKPLIKDCIKEVMFEDGVLSGIITEVARGLSTSPLIEKKQNSPAPQQDFKRLRARSAHQQKAKLQEQQQKLLDSIGSEAYNGVNLFEGTTPMTDGPAPGAAATPQGPLAGVASHDAGVDISQLFGSVGGHWKAHVSSGK